MLSGRAMRTDVEWPDVCMRHRQFDLSSAATFCDTVRGKFKRVPFLQVSTG